MIIRIINRGVSKNSKNIYNNRVYVTHIFKIAKTANLKADCYQITIIFVKFAICKKEVL